MGRSFSELRDVTCLWDRTMLLATRPDTSEHTPPGLRHPNSTYCDY